MSFNTFSEVMSYMDSFQNLEKNVNLYSSQTYKLERMFLLLKHMGNPQLEYKTIHVAGSKGKGSTCAFIAKALDKLGYKTGLYMSPHVSSPRERFTLALKDVDDKDLLSTGEQLKTYLDSFNQKPTTFEAYTAFAFLLFKNLKVDWAVVETGMGGRLDATNTVLPKACVLTPVEKEHTSILGTTVEKIAIEKSKIIKPNTPVFLSYQEDEAMSVFSSEASEQNSSFYSLKDYVKSIERKPDKLSQKVTVNFSDNSTSVLNLKMLGKVQAENCAVALMVLKELGLYKKTITEKALEETALPGRMENVQFSRPLYIDGSHTPNSIRNAVTTFKEMFGDTNGTCIFGCVSDKNADEMLKIILSVFNKVVICRPGTFKKSDVNLLYLTALNCKNKSQTIVLKAEAKDALNWVEENTDKNEPVLCCGSFYLAGVIKDEL